MRRPKGTARSRHRARYWRQYSRRTYHCPDCGRGEGHPDVERLEVHHRNGNPFDGQMSNLVALCHHCHRKRHGHEVRGTLEDWKMRGKLLGEIRQ